MICIFCRNEIRKLFSHVKEGHDRTGAEIAQSRSRLETITLVHLHDQARKKIHGMLSCAIITKQKCSIGKCMEIQINLYVAMTRICFVYTYFST